MFAPFSLPSRPSKKIILREATTAETLNFCDVLPDHEEALTTNFLNTVQDKTAFIDSRTWTADDRRLALFWYWLHTTENTLTSIDYTCPHCKKTHTHEFDMRELADGYQQMQGFNSRDVMFEGRKLEIKHLIGEHLEYLENMRLTANQLTLKQKSEIKFYKLKSSLSFSDDHEISSFARDNTLNNWLMNLNETKFHQLQKAVELALKDMTHGLPSQISKTGKISLLSPLHACPTLLKEGKEATTELLLPFRDYKRIPRI